MKNKLLLIVSVLIYIFLPAIFNSCSTKIKTITVIEERIELDTIYIHTTDTIDNTDYNIIDSLKSELLIKDLKLERIKEYNRIAASGNNLKFLRGWINRVLEE